MSEKILERIRKGLNYDYMMGNEFPVSLLFRDLGWLIEQAEQAKKLEVNRNNLRSLFTDACAKQMILEEENSRLHDILNEAKYTDNLALLEENRRYREALSFYAERKHYEVEYHGAGRSSANVIDYGDKARKALEEIK